VHPDPYSLRCLNNHVTRRPCKSAVHERQNRVTDKLITDTASLCSNISKWLLQLN